MIDLYLPIYVCIAIFNHFQWLRQITRGSFWLANACESLSRRGIANMGHPLGHPLSQKTHFLAIRSSGSRRPSNQPLIASCLLCFVIWRYMKHMFHQQLHLHIFTYQYGGKRFVGKGATLKSNGFDCCVIIIVLAKLTLRGMPHFQTHPSIILLVSLNINYPIIPPWTSHGTTDFNC